MKTYDQARTGAVLRARQLRHESTKPEKLLLRALRESFPDCKWRRQMPIGAYFADIACFAERLIIEADGGQHAEAQSYDAARTRFIEGQGYRVLRFWNNDIIESMNGVIGSISDALSPSRFRALPSLPLPRGEGF